MKKVLFLLLNLIWLMSACFVCGYSMEEDSYWNQFTSDYYYNSLSNDEKQLWNNLDVICSDYFMGNSDPVYCFEDYFLPAAKSPVNFAVDKKSAAKIAKMYTYSHPQYYFLANFWMYDSNSLSLGIYKDFSTREAINNSRKTFKDNVDFFLRNINKSGYPEEIEKQIHDLVCNNVSYGESDLDQSTFSSIVQRRTACSGYSKAMGLLSRACGLEVISVWGKGPIGGAHAWNMIKLHGYWYLLDVTNDSNMGHIRYEFYNIKNRDAVNKYEPSIGQDVGFSDISSYIPECFYNSVSPSTEYKEAYFTEGNYVYFSVSGTEPYIALGISIKNNASLQNLPDEVYHNGIKYTVINKKEISHFTQIEDFVNRLYKILLDREAEVAGLEDWSMKLLDQRADAANIVQGIVGSSEFQNKRLSNEDIVERMYKSMLGRASDSEGKAYWVKRLNSGMSVSSIINGFSGSPEFNNLCTSYGIKSGDVVLGENRDKNPGVTAFVSRCYTKALGRKFDIKGLNDWTGELLLLRQTPSQIARGFVFSTEFVNRNLNNEQFVDTMYALCFDRNADESGKKDWLSRLDKGTSREEIFSGFVESREFRELVNSFGL